MLRRMAECSGATGEELELRDWFGLDGVDRANLHRCVRCAAELKQDELAMVVEHHDRLATENARLCQELERQGISAPQDQKGTHILDLTSAQSQ